MGGFHSLSRLSLRVKLVLSYLAVALGAIIILAISIAFAVQNYFTQTQLEALRNQAVYRARTVEYLYQKNGATWGSGPPAGELTNDPVLLVIVESNNDLIGCVQPAFIMERNCDDPIIKEAMINALKGEIQSGRLPVTTSEGTFSSFYVSVPLQHNGQIIGAMLLSTPQIYPNAFPEQVNSSIFITVIIISLLVILISFLFARGLTRPLKALTNAAEEMKHGKYTQRVILPKAQDELGRLAQTFNEMADTIEADVNELRRQEQTRRDMLANIAHDLATPLTAVQGFSEALADNVVTDPVARYETAQHIKREVQRLRRLVTDLQQMSSLESGHAQLDLAPLNIYTLVDETLAVIVPECEQMGISVHNEIDPSIPAVQADSDRVTQVLLNLLDNARHHTSKGDKICVGAVPKGQHLHIWVSDTGTGIDPADLPHIFERFYRADRSRSISTGGSGLGLSIVKAIVTSHGGNIWAESTPNQGTRITFTLPLTA